MEIGDVVIVERGARYWDITNYAYQCNFAVTNDEELATVDQLSGIYAADEIQVKFDSGRIGVIKECWINQ